MSLLKLSLWDSVITDALHAISLSPTSMKAYYYLAQAEISLNRTSDALISSKRAHMLCVADIESGVGKNPQGSLGPITDLVLRCKKEDWERRERERLRGQNGLLDELVGDLRAKMEREIADVRGSGAGDGEVSEVEREYEGKIELLRRTFEAAAAAGSVEKRRKVPDWVLDDITFGVMLDPVVVSYPSISFVPTVM
jgi:STIP1 family protein 1